MAAPRLTSLEEIARRPELVGASIPLLLPPGARACVVSEPGSFLGRDYRRGDVLVFGEREDLAAPVLLAPRGRGAMRLGLVTPSALLGDRGEPCSPERFEVIGALVRVLRARPERVCSAGEVVGGAPRRVLPEPVSQLALFGRAA